MTMKTIGILTTEIKDLLRKMDERVREARKPHDTSAGEHLIEARCQMSYGEFRGWVNRNCGIGIKKAEYCMDLAYKARRDKQRVEKWPPAQNH
jgi:hypothetical protein